MKKVISTILAISLASICLTGCGDGSKPRDIEESVSGSSTKNNGSEKDKNNSKDNEKDSGMTSVTVVEDSKPNESGNKPTGLGNETYVEITPAEFRDRMKAEGFDVDKDGMYNDRGSQILFDYQDYDNFIHFTACWDKSGELAQSTYNSVKEMWIEECTEYDEMYNPESSKGEYLWYGGNEFYGFSMFRLGNSLYTYDAPIEYASKLVDIFNNVLSPDYKPSGNKFDFGGSSDKTENTSSNSGDNSRPETPDNSKPATPDSSSSSGGGNVYLIASPVSVSNIGKTQLEIKQDFMLGSAVCAINEQIMFDTSGRVSNISTKITTDGKLSKDDIIFCLENLSDNFNKAYFEISEGIGLFIVKSYDNYHSALLGELLGKSFEQAESMAKAL